jgi:hypothetical protein
MPDRYFCVHGHFYQPPRVDPFTGEIPQEYGAEPYSNWTEKIYQSCYRPNALIGNFEKISFNLGSTLTIGWSSTSRYAKEIVRQENAVSAPGGQQRHGAALLPYHHAAGGQRDKLTLVRWGLRDYQRLFGHLRRACGSRNRRGPGDAGRAGGGRPAVHHSGALAANAPTWMSPSPISESALGQKNRGLLL